jgi:hypothetical protein
MGEEDKKPNLPRKFVRDSAFSFKVIEDLLARIENGKMIIERKTGPFE